MVNRYINIWELFFPSHFGSEFKTFQLKLFNLATSYNRTIPRSASENTASRFFFIILFKCDVFFCNHDVQNVLPKPQ